MWVFLGSLTKKFFPSIMFTSSAGFTLFLEKQGFLPTGAGELLASVPIDKLLPFLIVFGIGYVLFNSMNYYRNYWDAKEDNAESEKNIAKYEFEEKVAEAKLEIAKEYFNKWKKKKTQENKKALLDVLKELNNLK